MATFRNTHDGSVHTMDTSTAATFNTETIRMWNIVDREIYGGVDLLKAFGLWETVNTCPENMTGFAGLAEIPVWAVSDSDLPEPLQNGHESDGRFVSPVAIYEKFSGVEVAMTRGEAFSVNELASVRNDRSGLVTWIRS